MNMIQKMINRSKLATFSSECITKLSSACVIMLPMDKGVTMQYKVMSVLGFCLFLVACGGEGIAPGNGNSGSGASTQGQSVSFVAFGDAGQQSGSGPSTQTAVGDAMAQICAERGCDFALELGDNIYLSGVDSVEDEQWQTKFEQPYANFNYPIYAALGNHDNSNGPGEGSGNAKGNFQVDYHYSGKSTKWNMPARYYNFTWPTESDSPIAEFFALDSNPLTAILPDPDPAFNFVTYGQEQQEWFGTALKESKAKWKIAFAHHPYLSNGLHGNAGNYDQIPDAVPVTASGKPWKDLLDATLCAEGADIFFQGHDHELQWLKPVEGCGKTQFVVSGAGEFPRPFADPERNETYWQQDETLGFFWFRLEENQLIGAAYILDANFNPQLAFEQKLPRQ